jgi:hypothetical protein
MKGKLSGCRLKSGVVGTVHCPLHRCKELMLDVCHNEFSSMDIK